MKDLDLRLGHVVLSPEGPVVAGSVGQWTLTFTVGSYGVDEGGTIKLTERFASDWEVPQFDRPDQPAFTTVVTDGDAKLAARYDPKAHERPWMKCMVIDVYDGSLALGDTVTITLGDQSQGSPGIRAQSFQESAHEFRLLVDPTNACLVRRVPSSPIFSVIADEPVELVVIVPTQTVVGQPTKIFVKGQDRWGNPTPTPVDVRLQWRGAASATINDGMLVGASRGTGRVVAIWREIEFASNPITISDAEQPLKKFWGDLHAQSDATVGTGTEVEYFTFGRDQAALDFTSHQGNDFQMTDEDWRRLNDVVRDFHEDGRFVVFPGYEWSANTPAGGDRNVFYLEEGMPIYRSSHWQIDEETAEDDLTPAHPADELFKRLRDNVDTSKVLLGSHVGGRYADIRRYFDEELGPLVEVVSCWGVFEWMLWDAFDKGYKVGVMCNSDGHKGRPGAEGPGAGEFGIASGLTCVLSESLTRESVFAALKNRRCYGTTGERIDLSFQVNGHEMGSLIEHAPCCRVAAAVRGTGPLDSLILYRGKEVIRTVRPTEFENCDESKRIRIIWGGARIRGRGRRVTWDGTIEIDGAQIQRVASVSFDSPADGIDEVTESTIRFRSRTTGDLDGVDVWLDQATSGMLRIQSKLGELEVDLADLNADGTRKDFGGLDLHVLASRYPESPLADELVLDCEVEIADGCTPLFVKAVQVDGHMAWSSPIYVVE